MTITQASKEIQKDRSLIYWWVKNNKIPYTKIGGVYSLDLQDLKDYINREEKKRCKFCENDFTTKKDNQIFCSNRCRDKQWLADNPERYKEHQRKSQFKLNPVICKLCEHKIPDRERKMGKVYCNSCLPDLNQLNLKKAKKNAKSISKEFIKFKENLGCCRCGYSKFGGSLDFHHIDPLKKERRIDSKMWHYKTELYTEEFKKCILVCKNCHYEIHHDERIKKIDIDENGDSLSPTHKIKL